MMLEERGADPPSPRFRHSSQDGSPRSSSPTLESSSNSCRPLLTRLTALESPSRPKKEAASEAGNRNKKSVNCAVRTCNSTIAVLYNLTTRSDTLRDYLRGCESDGLMAWTSHRCLEAYLQRNHEP